VRRDPEFFGDAELDLIYIAKKLKDALRVEELFTDSGVDYLVETETYTGGVMFRTERVGAFFYIAPGAREAVAPILAGDGFEPYDLPQ
jgi:hypothetical protein